MNAAQLLSFCPPYVPPRWLVWGPFPSGHALTLATAMRKRPLPLPSSTKHFVHLEDGDSLVLHDLASASWRPGLPVTLLIHGLAGCHNSSYMVRLTRRLLMDQERPRRVFRMDLRGAGDGESHAKRHYHAARLDDLSSVMNYLRETIEGSPLEAVGFSLGGGMLLRWAAEKDSETYIKRLAAICPPIDLAFCCARLRSGWLRPYDRFFAKTLWRSLQARRKLRPDMDWVELSKPPQGLWEFDHQFTAPLAGFASADDYYNAGSAKPHMANVAVPTLVIASQDDPVCHPQQWQDVKLNPQTNLQVTRYGGHVGYLSAGKDHWPSEAVAGWLNQ